MEIDSGESLIWGALGEWRDNMMHKLHGII